MKKALAPVLIGLALSACAGSVVTVDGVTFDLEDIPVETDASTVEMELFRNAINWVIANKVVTRAAEDEFGIILSENEVEEAALLLLAGGNQLDPRTNLDFLRIQARIGPNGLLWPEVGSNLPEGVSPFQWANDQLSTADVEVNVRFGEWRASPAPGVYEP